MQNGFFTDEIIKKADRILDYVLNNRYSHFYNDRYSHLGIKNINDFEDFSKLPILTKDEVMSVNLNDRILIPPEKLTGYKFTSGTTSNNRPTVLPEDLPELVSHEIRDYVFDEDLIASLGATKILVLYPMTWVSLKILGLEKNKLMTVCGNLNNLDLTARITKETGLDGIMTSSTALVNLVVSLKKIDFDFSSIKFIVLSSEYCSNPKFNFFKKIFPNAHINFRYGNAETGLRGYRCLKLTESHDPNFYHLRDDIFLEIENPDEEGYGNIIHTDLFNRSFPFIRYRTGDIGRLSEYECECGEHVLLELGGRKDLDVFKFNGITLHIKAIETALENIYDYVGPQFQIHVYEKRVGATIEPYFELYLKLKSDYESLSLDDKFRLMLENKISEALFLTDKLTLKNLVKDDFILPLKIIFKESFIDGFKNRSIISHLND